MKSMFATTFPDSFPFFLRAMIPRRRQSSRDYRPSTNRPTAELAENSCAASDESVRDLAFERALSAILFSALRAPVGVEIHVDLS